MHIYPRHRLALLATSVLGLAIPALASARAPCVLEYRRADNMWANWGRPDGLLGAETITLQPGQKKVFATDWSYETQKNDGTNFYGSHLRRAVNRGSGPYLAEVSCPGAATVVASVAPPPAPPVVLSLTGARTTTGSTVTVTANAAASGAALTGKVTINGASGELGKEIAFTPCSETLDIQDARGVTRTRTLRAPCEGVVQIGGYPDTYFNF